MVKNTDPDVLRFAGVEILPRERRLLRQGEPVPLGGRAFDLLLALAERPGEAVNAQALLQRVWPAGGVRANNLRVQLNTLRKALGAQAIRHLAGRGYVLTLQPLTGEAGDDSTPRPPSNLGPQAPTLLGRDAELQQALDALAAHQRVTLHGAAGVGKTSLALCCAHALDAEFSHGVWWVDLAGLSEAALLVPTVAALLQCQLGSGEPLAELARLLAPRTLLLVLDNCEHLSHAVAQLADALLHAASGIKLLASSRRPLKCAGEQLLRLGALALPAGSGLRAARSSPAVALFQARAVRADERFALTADNADAVAAICSGLDGNPLAISMAAARVPLLGVAGLQERLDQRLRLLSHRDADAQGRHQALQAALDWSHALLQPLQQQMLRSLGVFSGSFSLASVQALAADDGLQEWDVLDALQALIDLSLLEPEESGLQGAGSPRYRLHETVRLYAWAQLEAQGESQRRARAHALLVLRLLGGPPRSAREGMEPDLPEAEHPNWRAAVAWALENDFALCLQLVTEAAAYLRRRGHHFEALRLNERLLGDARTQQHPVNAARLHLSVAALHSERNQMDTVLQHARAALGLVSEQQRPDVAIRAWGWIGNAHHGLLQFDAAEAAFREALRQARAAALPVEEAYALSSLGCVYGETGRQGEAVAVLDEALALHRGCGSRWGTAVALESLGEARYAQGRFDAALDHWREALQLFRQMGHQYQEAQAQHYMGLATRRLGLPQAARTHALAAVDLCLRNPLTGVLADALSLLAGLALDAGHAERAALLLGLARQRRGSTPAVGPVALELPRIEAGLVAALGAGGLQAALAQGQALGVNVGDAELRTLAAG